MLLLILISMAGASAADDNDIVTVGENIEVIDQDSGLASQIEISDSDSDSDIDYSDDFISDLDDANLYDEVSSPSGDNNLYASDEDEDEDDPSHPVGLVGSFTELDGLIQRSSGEIRLDKDYVFNPLTDSKYIEEGIKINKDNVWIDGQGHFIDGAGKSALMTLLSKNNISLKDINFVNGYLPFDAPDDFQFAPFLITSCECTVSNCTFAGNKGPAGAVAVIGLGNIENCTFINNTGGDFGGAYFTALGFTNYVLNSKFIGNHANKGGAALSTQHAIYIYCTFENNTADYGGALYFMNMGIVETSLFTHNRAKQGGAIYSECRDVDVKNSYFILNDADDTSSNVGLDEGSISSENNYPSNLVPYDFSRLQQDINNCAGNVFTLTNDYYCTVDNARAFPNGVKVSKENLIIDGKGHIIYASNRTKIFDVIANGVTFRNITFVGGCTDGEGGAISFSNDGIIDNCTFLDNHAGSGGAVSFGGDGTITTTAFVNNTASDKGGAVCFHGTGDITGAVFANNIAMLGGAVYSNGPVNIQLVNFTFNQADEGGALYLENGGELLYSTFMYNIAKSFGGAISTSGDLTAKLSEFDTNIAPDASYNVKLRNGAELIVQGGIPYVLIPKSFADLEREIGEAENLLTLTEDYFFNPDYDDVGGITISKDNFVLDGQGHILYGSNKTRLFSIEGENVTLKNLLIVNFLADGNNGDTIVKFFKNGTVDNCTFINSTSSRTVLAFNGGEIKGSIFANNTAIDGGAVNLNDGTIDSCIFSENRGQNGGAVHMNNYGEIINSTFYNNYASDYAGAIFVRTNALIRNCTVLQNYARWGGAVYANKDLTVELSNFMSNEALLYGAIAVIEYASITDSNFLFNQAEIDGCLYLVRGTVKNSNFTGNEGKQGAAINFYWYGLVENSTFNLNDNVNSDGGAIYFMVNGTVLDSTFNLNKGKCGGAIYISHTGLISNSTFNMNEAVLGSAIYSVFEYIIVEDSSFNNNSATNGTVYFKVPGAINDCTFNINQAENGAGIYTVEDMEVNRCSFNGNQAVNGAAVFFAKDGKVYDSDFYYNIGELESGSVLYFNNSGAVENSNFLNDIAGSVILFKEDGTVLNSNFNNTIGNFGAVNFESSGLVNNSKFNNCSGITYGAGISMSSGKVENCEFTNNMGNYSGGIFAQDAIVENCLFSDNTGNYSSGICALGEAIVKDCSFTGNLGNRSGAVHIEDGLIQDSYFFNNTAEGNGGAVYIGNAEVRKCIFDSNIVGGQGGAVYSKNGSVKDCSFTNHIAGSDGGAIFADNVTIEDAYFYNNTAVYDGGAVCIRGTGLLNNTEFESNYAVVKAKSYGGALYINKGVVDNSFFNNSIALQVGGAIYAVDAIVNNSVFNNNSALFTILSGYGGAVYFRDNGIAENSNFTNNHATFSGGAIHFNGKGSVKNCIFENNAMGDEENIVGFGGAVTGYDEPLTVEDSLFINNFGGKGGAIYLNGGDVRNCSFINNSATFREGGAISSIRETSIDNCTFAINHAATDGGAVSISRNSTISNSFFFNNSAEERGGAIYLEGYSDIKNCYLYGSNASSGGAIFSNSSLQVRYSIFDSNSAVDGTGNIGVIGDGRVYLEYVTPENLGPMRVVTAANDSPYIIVASDCSYVINHGGKYSVMVKDKFNVLAVGGTVDLILNGVNIASGVTDENGMVTLAISAKDLKDAKAGTKDLVIIFTDYNNVSVSKTVNMTINKEKSSITAKAKSYVINYGGKYSITLKDSKGKAIANKKVTFYLKGKKIGTAKTNSKGVATIKLTAKMLKTAKAGKRNLKVKFAGDSYYKSASKTVKITIKKEKTKIVAKAKSFKRALKTKKYSVTLKNSKGKAVKKMTLILKVNGKTFKAKTNSKGKAVFKIKKLYKRGTFKSTVTFKGNAKYLKATKKVQIKIK